MFDFRYHLASLTAVFLALMVGILVGVGLSGRGFVDDAERTRLNNDIADLKGERDAARELLESAQGRQTALEDYADETYPVLAPGRLEDRRVAVVFVGPVDQAAYVAVAQAVRDAGGRIVRVRALGVPFDAEAVQARLGETPSLGRYAGAGRVDALGRELGRELVNGGRTPVWDTLGDELGEEQSGPAAVPADAAVVVRAVRPQQGATQDFLAGLYAGMARAGVPSVGVEKVTAERSAVEAFARAGLSTVDGVDTSAGRLALVLLLAGAAPGQYGAEPTATSGVLPPLEPLARPSG